MSAASTAFAEWASRATPETLALQLDVSNQAGHHGEVEVIRAEIAHRAAYAEALAICMDAHPAGKKRSVTEPEGS